jgi:CHAT domain-containing protein
VIAPDTSARELLVSLISEERRGRPGAATDATLVAARADAGDAGTHLIVAVYAAFAAGEPRQALRLLEDIARSSDATTQRRIRACRAWAEQLDRNWYPGDTGAEGAISKEGLTFVREVLPGDAETMLVEACVVHGPAKLLSVRSLLESMVRKSAREAPAVLRSGLGDLERFKEIALACNAPASACWAMQAQADLLRRSGHATDAQHQLERAREVYAAGEDGIGVACTYVVEGDWWATPGSSPEALGLDLGGRPEPSPFADALDTVRAADAYHKAESALLGTEAPRLVGALALRRAVLCFLSGSLDEQLRWLRTADQAFAEAGETSGRHLVYVHRLVGAVSRGDFVQLRREAPPEWGTAHGPIADIAAWGAARGSLSFCAGLGRILERTAEGWEGRGDLDRAEFAYLMARPLLSLSGFVPEWVTLLALAKLDARRNVQVKALVRRLRVLANLPPPPRTAENSTEWMRDLYLTMPLIDIPSGMIGTGPIAMQTIDRGAERLSALLNAAGHANAGEPLPALDVDAMLDELRRAWADFSPYDAMRQGESQPPRFTQLAVATAALAGREQLARAKPQVSLLRALQAERLGWNAEADQWYETALEQIDSAGDANRWLGVLTLSAWGKHEEARALLTRLRAGRMINRTLLPSLALRARDFESARELFRRLDEQSAPGELSWIDLLDRAEAALECGDAAAALEPALRAVASFEGAIYRLPRDPDRVAACDDVKAAALYLLVSRVHLALADRSIERGDEAGQVGALGRAFSSADRGHTLALPRLTGATEATGSLEDRQRRWQQAATEQLTAYQRYLAALALGGTEPAANLADELSRTEQGLAEIEANLESAERTSLLETHRPKDFTLVDAQSVLPAGACLLEYHLVGRDLVAWGVAKSSVRGWHKRLSGRPLDGAVRRLLRSCASGAASIEADELARLLLDPFAEMLDANDRVIVVPFGPLHAVPFHVLPFRGEPLGANHVLSYLPAASLLSGSLVDRKLGNGGALVVGDPAFDPQSHPSLRRLAGAALEAGVVGRLYGTRDVFRAGDAREAALRPLLRGRAVVHFAAHGRLDETAPNTSSIVLAGNDQLTVSDLIGVRIDADLVVLSACDTGRGAMSLGGDLVGLTRGLLAAGVRRSLVSLWPVDDVAACVTMVAFHEKMLFGERDAPALALARAQREIRAMSGGALAARYRELGGELEPGRASTRRKSSEPRWNTHSLRRLAPFPETDLDDTLARTLEESHGSLASIWAPFVLIGC